MKAPLQSEVGHGFFVEKSAPKAPAWDMSGSCSFLCGFERAMTSFRVAASALAFLPNGIMLA
jgi:hypothetical protein